MPMFGDDDEAGGLHEHFMPNVRFQFDDDPDPYKRRRKNMKRALKVLKPARSKWPPWGFKFDLNGQCSVTGADLRALGFEAYDKALLDPHTYQPLEDGRTLMSEFFQDHITGKAITFSAQSRVDSGIPLRSSYCPGLLQVYWLYTQWRYEEQMENQGRASSFLRSRGIEMKPLRRKKKAANGFRPQLVDELEPFYVKCKMHEGRGVRIAEHSDPNTGEVDYVHITLCLREMREWASKDEPKGQNGGASSGE